MRNDFNYLAMKGVLKKPSNDDNPLVELSKTVNYNVLVFFKKNYMSSRSRHHFRMSRFGGFLGIS